VFFAFAKPGPGELSIQDAYLVHQETLDYLSLKETGPNDTFAKAYSKFKQGMYASAQPPPPHLPAEFDKALERLTRFEQYEFMGSPLVGCAVCGASNNLKECARCRQTQYCSIECQSKDWSREEGSHKDTCRGRGA